MATPLRTVSEQPDTDAVKAQTRHVLDVLETKFPTAAAHLDAAQHDLLAFTAFPREIWRQIWSNNAQVIWSRPKGVLHVVQEAVKPGDLRGGCGYLPPSMTQVLRRNSAGPTRALTRLAA